MVKNNRYYFLVNARGHTKLDLQYAIDNSIRGWVLGPDDRPIEKLCVYAVEKNRADTRSYGPFGCTDKDGTFAIERLYDDQYILAINGDGRIQAAQPYPTTFYPGVLSRDKALILRVQPGTKLTLRAFKIPTRIPTVLLGGKVTYADGKGFDAARIKIASILADERLESDPYIWSKDDGNFSLSIFSGQKGKVRAEKIIKASLLDKCEGIRNSVIQENAGGSLTIATPWVPISGESDLTTLKLVFPFPYCHE
jgi:hypothetical protein